jgi:hypothetical protein
MSVGGDDSGKMACLDTHTPGSQHSPAVRLAPPPSPLPAGAGVCAQQAAGLLCRLQPHLQGAARAPAWLCSPQHAGLWGRARHSGLGGTGGACGCRVAQAGTAEEGGAHGWQSCARRQVVHLNTKPPRAPPNSITTQAWPASLSRLTAVEPSSAMQQLGMRLEAARRFAHPTAPLVRREQRHHCT